MCGQFARRYWNWLTPQYPSFVKRRLRQLLSRLWVGLTFSSVAASLLSTTAFLISYSQGKPSSPEASEGLKALIYLVIFTPMLGVFVLFIILVCILALFPEGQKVIDKVIDFSEPAWFKEFKNEVEDKLISTNERINNTEIATNDRLKNIEAILKTLVGGDSPAGTSLDARDRTK